MRALCFVTALLTLIILTGCAGQRDNLSPSGAPETPESTASQPEVVSTAEAEESSDTAMETAPQVFTLTIPEGYTLARIGMTLEDAGICTTDEFIAAAQALPLDEYSLLNKRADNPNRCFSLEGYLFPDTYEIYLTDSPELILERMLRHMEYVINEELRTAIEASGYSTDEILSMASIIEKEAFGSEQMPLISSVLHNRLELGMPLQCDVTRVYVEGAIKPFIDGDQNRYNEYYNTYKCPALPAGAICNPGIEAIQAALNPAQTDYLFFVTDAEQKYYYAETYEEHLVNINTAGIHKDTEEDTADSEADS